MAASTTSRELATRYLIEVPAVLVTFVMMVHITLNAVMRTWWDRPLGSTLEVVEYWYLPLVAFLGFVAAQHRGQHIAADLLFERFPEATKRYVLAVVLGLCAVVCAGFAWFGWQEAVHAWDIKLVAGLSSLPAWPTYFLVPLAFASLTVQLVASAGIALRNGAVEVPVNSPEETFVLSELAEEEER